MTRLPIVRFAVGLTAALLLTSVAVVSGTSHDEEAAEPPRPADAPGPDPGKPIAMPPGLVGLKIELGLEGAQPGGWQVEVAADKGEVLDLEIVRAGPNAAVEGNTFRTGGGQQQTKKKAQAKKNAQQKKKAQQKKQQAANSPELRANLDVPADAQITLRTNRGDVAVRLADLPRDERRLFLDGQVGLTRQAAALRLTGPATEDDFPVAARAPDGAVWLAYVAYEPEIARLNQQPAPDDFDRLVPTKHGDQIKIRKFDGQAWRPALDVTGPRLDVWRPTVAVDKGGKVWVAWAQQVDNNWDIYFRTYSPDGDRWSDTTRVAELPGSDFHAVAAADAGGTVWLAWQGWRGDNFEIMAAALADGHPWSKPRAISESPANDWGPAIAADSKGRVHVAWDTYDKGQYDVRIRTLADDAEPIAVADSARFEARPHLACDADGRTWIAYEEGDEQWGKDYASDAGFQRSGLAKNPGFALYVNRTVRVKCLDDGRLLQPAGPLDDALEPLGRRNESVPRLVVDPDGSPWLFFRHHPLGSGAGEVWVGSAVKYDGRAWSGLKGLSSSSNLIDNRPALVPLDSGVLAVYSGDRRNNTQSRGQDDLFAARFAADSPASEAPELVAAGPAPAAAVEPVHPDESADIARLREHRVQVGGKSLRLLRGEFHRHTEFTSHRDQDGLLEDTWRYALDAADHDWMGNGDHMNGFNFEYLWWLIQKNTDLHLNPGFVAAQSYERSAVFPNGHRNVIMPRRGIRPLPFGDLKGTPEAGTPDTKVLYQYLKHFGGMCASHTSATNMGTDWRDNDAEVEPVVEIYQGHRHNYEHLGAPRSPTEETQIGGFQPAGFIWNALEKGYKLGFQSSSDHVSTHWSYAIVLAEEPSRQGIIDAFKQRHSYAATDNILLVARSGDHLMGESFTTREKPALDIEAVGTAPIARLHVIRDNKYALSTEPKQAHVKFHYTDDDAELKPGQTHYYYVRIEQADGNLAWASPLWITYRP